MRLSEIYTSIQGEGPGAGKPTQFVRFAGCNLKCPGWPCDTQHAIDPKLYRDEWTSHDAQSLRGLVDSWPRAVTLTGGEPLLQPAEGLNFFASSLLEAYYSLELFTNGTFELPAWAANFHTRIIMDWKLPGSGEDPYNLMRIANVQHRLSRYDAVKFVCSSKEDFDLALELKKKYIDDPQRTPWYMPHVYVGASWEQLEEKELVEWMLKAQVPNLELNVQVHNYIWPRDERLR